MKKIFLSFVLCFVAVVASAQLKSLDAKFDLRGETGLGVGATMDIGDNIEFSPSLSLFFPEAGAMYTAEANFHYILPVDVHEQLDLFPIAGAGYFHYGYDFRGDSYSYNQLLVNIGFGARWHINETWAAFAEEKIQFTSHYNDNFLSIGVSYSF